MRLFDPRDREITPRQARRYALFEVLHTVVDFAAAFLFVIGSILFFFEQTMVPGTWCFLFGSFFFAAKPTIRLAREIWLARLQDVDRLAEMAPEGPGTFEKLTDDNDNGVPDAGEVSAEADPADGKASSGRFNREA
ncbi:YrhK family protein [Citricoccus nitrophenolicus]|uniref:YrhK family protein n=1 Tax=Citricoccus nitrophenolicus TaxID=863575 RepID=UPI0031EC04E2